MMEHPIAMLLRLFHHFFALKDYLLSY